MTRQNIKEIILNAVNEWLSAKDLTVLTINEIEVSKPQIKSHGDYASSVALKLAKVAGLQPLEVAEQLKTVIAKQPGILDMISKIEVAAPGFINITLNQDYLYRSVDMILDDPENYGKSTIGEGKKMQVEFISANPTGPLTLANARGGFVGDCLAKLFMAVGYEVEKEYYINDTGNQVRTLGKAVLAAAGKIPMGEDYYRGEHIDDWAAEHPETLARFKDDAESLGRLVAKDFLQQFIQPAVQRMGVEFNVWFSEYERLHASGQVAETFTWLNEQGLLYEADGAWWFRTTKFGDDKDRVVKTGEGELTYFLVDIAHHKEAYDRGYHKINIVGADHHGYVGRMMAATEALGYQGQLRMLVMQLVKLVKDGKEVKSSKRLGQFVTVDELLDEVSSDVARFFFLIPSVNTPMTFDLALAKEKSDRNPVYYAQYAYTRIASIEREVAERQLSMVDNEYEHEAEWALIKELLRWPEVVEDAVSNLAVNYLPEYARQVAEAFHHFYNQARVIDNDEVHAERLKLCQATKAVLGRAFAIMGISAPERM